MMASFLYQLFDGTDLDAIDTLELTPSCVMAEAGYATQYEGGQEQRQLRDCRRPVRAVGTSTIEDETGEVADVRSSPHMSL